MDVRRQLERFLDALAQVGMRHTHRMKTRDLNRGVALNVWATWLLVAASTFIGKEALAQPAAPSRAAPAHALNAPGTEPDTEAVPDGDGKWVLGLTVSATPSYAGASDRQWGIRPVLAGRVGRWMVSTSSARRLAGLSLAGGISTTVVDSERWQLGLGIRLTHGRDSADNALLVGLPDVRSSLALRASSHWVLTPAWRVTGSLQQDLQRGQGLHATVGLGWSRRLASGWTLDAGSGVTWANARAMNTFYGVSPDQARAGRGAWLPGAGLEQWHWGVGASRALSTHWRVATSVGRSTLLGGAAHSPLTLQRSGTTAQVSLAYVGW